MWHPKTGGQVKTQAQIIQITSVSMCRYPFIKVSRSSLVTSFHTHGDVIGRFSWCGSSLVRCMYHYVTTERRTCFSKGVDYRRIWGGTCPPPQFFTREGSSTYSHRLPTHTCTFGGDKNAQLAGKIY